MVFFDGAGLSTSHAGVADQIFSVRITGGSITRVAAGMDPQLSPDGRMLAYVASDPLGEAPYLARTGGVEIGEVHGGGISDVRALRPGQEQLGLGLSQLSWSPDSHNLAFDLYDGSTNATTFWRLAISNHVTSLALAQEIRLHQPGLTWNGYLGHDQNGRAIGLGVLTSASGAQQLVTVNPVTGGVVRTLFGVPGAVCVPATPASSPRCADPFNDAVSSDSSGRDLLVAGVIPPKGVAATTLSSQDLYRWSAGDRAPLRLTTDVALAAWGPDSAG
jgi:hypothetical protein